MKIECVATEQFSSTQNAALTQLGAAVYPPEVRAQLPGKLVSWATPHWSILVWDYGELVSRVGVLVREIAQDGVYKRIGGIGGVLTHPANQGQGLASHAMRAAVTYLTTEMRVSFAMLFCRPHLLAFYQWLGWTSFQGTVYVEQPEGTVVFSINRAMLHDGTEQAPVDGGVDLKGLPW